MRPLALSHLSIVTSLGAGLRPNLAALREGASGLRPCHFETVDLETYVGEIADLDAVRMRGDLTKFDCRNNRLAQFALEQDRFAQAVAAAREKYGPARIGVFMGTSTSGILQTEVSYRARDPESGALPPEFDFAGTHDTFSIGDFVRRYLDLAGHTVVISAACASSAKAFGNAARMIDAGLCDAAIVGGADSLCLTTLYGFNSLELLSRDPCRPFDSGRDGISVGEGAGFVLLEKPHHRAGDDQLLLLGTGESSDAYHMSTPHPQGVGARLAMERALAAAGLQPRDIDYVNLHGTATKSGDASEDLAVSQMFGATTPCSSTKGHTGHTLGAAGITEAIFSALALRYGLMPGSPHTRAVDPAFSIRYSTKSHDMPLNLVMTNSFGFGGSNCSLILGRTR